MRRLAWLLLLAAGGSAAQVPHIGRLFTTPAERYQLDLARARGSAGQVADARSAPDVAPAVTPAPPPAPVVVSGLVTRSNGTATAWIDGVAQPVAPQGVQVRTQDGRQVTVKPGQQVDPSTGSVQDAPGR